MVITRHMEKEARVCSGPQGRPEEEHVYNGTAPMRRKDLASLFSPLDLFYCIFLKQKILLNDCINLFGS